jgi:hypothetical protein
MTWTPRRAAAISRLHIKSLRKQIEKHLSAIAQQWGDEDGFLEREPDEMARRWLGELDELEGQVAHSRDQEQE